MIACWFPSSLFPPAHLVLQCYDTPYFRLPILEPLKPVGPHLTRPHSCLSVGAPLQPGVAWFESRHLPGRVTRYSLPPCFIFILETHHRPLALRKLTIKTNKQHKDKSTPLQLCLTSARLLARLSKWARSVDSISGHLGNHLDNHLDALAEPATSRPTPCSTLVSLKRPALPSLVPGPLALARKPNRPGTLAPKRCRSPLRDVLKNT